MSLRRLRVLIDGLPYDSTFIRAAAPWAAWGTTDHLIANLIDVEGMLAHGSKWTPIQRPGREQKESTQRNARHERYEKAMERRRRELAQRRKDGADG